MATAHLNYADPVRLDPLPALRRIRALAIAWAGFTFASALANFMSNILWPYEGGGWEFYASEPGAYLAMGKPLAAVLVASACVVWKKKHEPRRRVTTVGLCLLATMLLVSGPPAWYVLGSQPVWPGMPTLVWQLSRELLIAAVPLALTWAALNPLSFDATRLAAIASVAMLLFAAQQMLSIADLLKTHSMFSRDFWGTLFSWGWHVVLVMFICGLVAAPLFAIAIRPLRRGGIGAAALAGSWLVVALVAWLCAVPYGFLWDAHVLSAHLHALRILSNALFLLMMLCAGLAFIVPVSTSKSRIDHPSQATI